MNKAALNRDIRTCQGKLIDRMQVNSRKSEKSQLSQHASENFRAGNEESLPVSAAAI